jgi:hypothetical protein
MLDIGGKSMDMKIINGHAEAQRDMKEKHEKIIKKKLSLFYICLNILVITFTICLCLCVLLKYNLIGSYSMRVLVKVPVETVDLNTIAAAYMPELNRDAAIDKIMVVNRFHSRALTLLKGDELYVPMHRGSRMPPEELLVATAKRIKANDEMIEKLKAEEGEEAMKKIKDKSL